MPRSRCPSHRSRRGPGQRCTADVRMLGCGPLTGGYAVDGSRVRRAEEWVESERVCEFRLRSGGAPSPPPAQRNALSLARAAHRLLSPRGGCLALVANFIVSSGHHPGLTCRRDERAASRSVGRLTRASGRAGYFFYSAPSQSKPRTFDKRDCNSSSGCSPLLKGSNRDR